MKALSPVPVRQNLDTLLDFCDEEEPSLISGECATYIQPVEIRRFIRALREYRQFVYTNDFIF